MGLNWSSWRHWIWGIECCEQTQFRKSVGVELHEIHIRKHISIAFFSSDKAHRMLAV